LPTVSTTNDVEKVRISATTAAGDSVAVTLQLSILFDVVVDDTIG
jgi:hypothetical protein